MPVSLVFTIWTCRDLRCESVRYNEPPGLEVQLWQGRASRISPDVCGRAAVATEADRRFDACCPPADR